MHKREVRPEAVHPSLPVGSVRPQRTAPLWGVLTVSSLLWLASHAHAQDAEVKPPKATVEAAAVPEPRKLPPPPPVPEAPKTPPVAAEPVPTAVVVSETVVVAAPEGDDKAVIGSPVGSEPAVLVDEPDEIPALASLPPDSEEDDPSATPSLKIGMGIRTGLAFGQMSDPKDKMELSLNDGLVDQIHIRPYFSAQLTKRVAMVGNFEVGTKNGLGQFNILDAIIQVKFMDELQLWVGQHIPANDRNNMCGPFFHNSWNFAIDVPSYAFDQGARDRGATLWGLVGGGILKYHLSLVDLQPGRNISNARFAGRVTINLLDPENYYYASGTYYGEQDTLAIGGVFSYQNGVGGDSADNDFIGYSFDGLFEKTTDGFGTYTLEAGYWNFENVGYNYVSNQGTIDAGLGVVGPFPGQAALVGVSWLTPKNVGTGKIQPNARFQWGKYSSQAADGFGGFITQDATRKVVDLGVAYVVDGYNHRWHLNFRHGDRGGVKEDMFQLGVQIQI